jgi:hypothetical protein
MKIKESSVQKSIQSISPTLKCNLFRNNVGLFKVFEKGKQRCIRTGLCKGSSDLIGYTKKTITPDMVGKQIAIFTAIEVKKPEWKENKKLDRHELEQKRFIDDVEESGGIAGFANSVDKFIEIVK